jgi:hypothetical protein
VARTPFSVVVPLQETASGLFPDHRPLGFTDKAQLVALEDEYLMLTVPPV